MRYIDYEKIDLNIKILKQKHPMINLVLKDDAYSLGILNILEIGIKNGIYKYSVNNKEDALKIIEYSNLTKILMLGKEKMIHKNVILTVESYDDYLFMKKYQQPFYLKIKSDMNRFGMHFDSLISKDPLCKGIYLHNPYQNKLSKKIIDVANNLKKKKPSLFISLGGSSLFEFNFPFEFRCGILIYKDAIFYKTNILKIGYLKKGEGLGYDLKYKAKKRIRYAIINIGYKNGFRRKSKMKVAIQNKLYKVCGYLCMDYAFLLIDSSIKKEDRVDIVSNKISLEKAAKWQKMSIYEFLVNIR